MSLPRLPATPIERRNAIVGAVLVGTVVAVLAFGSGVGRVLDPPDAAGAGRGATDPASTTRSEGDPDGAPLTFAYAASGRRLSASSSAAHDASDDPGEDMSASPEEAASPAAKAVSCPALSEAVLAPFVVHFNKAHLERSPGEQAQDALDVDQYAKTHTVLFGSMFAPLFHLVQTAPSGLNPFVVHFNKAHLERSPGEQARDAADADQYAKTHTVMFGDMLKPTTEAMTGSETC